MQEQNELNPSELGTQEYWKQAYTKEIENFDECGDPGEIWFGECSTFKVLRWITDSGLPKESKIIDIGCGNGFTLMELAGKGYTNLVGVDYCEEAIALSKKVSDEVPPVIEFKVIDITQEDQTKQLGKFDIVLDKGTYDAISLNPEDSKSLREAYIKNVVEMIEENGLFLMTSCNWTEEELLEHFSMLALKQVLPMPNFVYGGKSGNVVTSLIFEKNVKA